MDWVFNQGSVRNCNRIGTLPVAKSSQVGGAGAVATTRRGNFCSHGGVSNVNGNWARVNMRLLCAMARLSQASRSKGSSNLDRNGHPFAMKYNLNQHSLITRRPGQARSAPVVGGVRMTFYLWIPNCKLLTCFTQVMADQARPAWVRALTSSVHVHVQLLRGAVEEVMGE